VSFQSRIGRNPHSIIAPVPAVSAVFFDVDFTLIHPGPRFQARGYVASCARHGIVIDPLRFDRAVAAAAPLLESGDHIYDGRVYERYTRRIIELMGGSGPALDAAAREIFLEWAEHRHFELYPDVPETLERLHRQGVRIGLISNTHRCLTSFEAHFELDGLISATVSSYQHGYMKPHPSIFRAALELLEAAPADAAMVGDSLRHDVLGAREIGMRGILLARGDLPAETDGVEVVRSLVEVPDLLKAPVVPQ
jgi:putative hydrolase of the HAD superfamily